MGESSTEFRDSSPLSEHISLLEIPQSIFIEHSMPSR